MDHNLKTAYTFFSAILSFTFKWHWPSNFSYSLSLLLRTYREGLTFMFNLQTVYTFTCIITQNPFSHAFIQHFHSTAKEWSIQAITHWCYPRVNCSVSVQRYLCQYLDVYFMSYYSVKMNKKQKKESADTSDKKYGSC